MASQDPGGYVSLAAKARHAQILFDQDLVAADQLRGCDPGPPILVLSATRVSSIQIDNGKPGYTLGRRKDGRSIVKTAQEVAELIISVARVVKLPLNVVMACCLPAEVVNQLERLLQLEKAKPQGAPPSISVAYFDGQHPPYALPLAMLRLVEAGWDIIAFARGFNQSNQGSVELNNAASGGGSAGEGTTVKVEDGYKVTHFVQAARTDLEL